MSESVKTCVDVYPPGFSPADNPEALAALRSGAGKAAIVEAKRWSDRDTLHVCFLDGEPALQRKVEQFARQWCEYANIKLVFDNAPHAEIRISFRYAGSWSFVGVDALDENIPLDQPTMNFGWLTTSTPNDEVSRVVLHEFGHALGLIHEHQNPAAAIPWNKEVVYEYYSGPPNNWTKEQIDVNLFQLYSAQLTAYSAFDPDSIMLYPIPAEFLTDPAQAVGWNRTLSETDKEFIGRWYPRATDSALASDAGPRAVNPALEEVRSSVRGAAPTETFRIDESLHRLQWNESPFDFPADLKEEVLQRMANTDWARYPTMLRPFDLIARVAQRLGVPPESVVVSSGSSELIRTALSAYLEPGDNVVMPSPTFLLYKRTAGLLGANVWEASCRPENGFTLPVDELITLAQEKKAQLMVLCAPNNPTGTVFPIHDLRRLAAECGAALLIDEAYGEFSGQDLIGLQTEHENVILLRTFSKAFSMAGVRVGYAIAAPQVAANLQKLITAFPISLFSEAVAHVALAHHDRFMASVREVVAERERLAAELAALPGLTVFPSGTNFLLVRPTAPAQEVFQHLRQSQRVLINDASSYPELDNYLRISVGRPEQNDLVVQGFREMSGLS